MIALKQRKSVLHMWKIQIEMLDGQGALAVLEQPLDLTAFYATRLVQHSQTRNP